MWKENSNKFKRLLNSRFRAVLGGNGFFYNQHNFKGLAIVFPGGGSCANMPDFTPSGS